MKTRFYPEKYRVLLAALLLIAFFPNFTENSGFYLSGLSPYHTALASFEKDIFQKFVDARRKEQPKYEDNIRKNILEIISKYHTRLDKKRLQQLPDWIIEESKRYGYDPLFLTAIIITESSFNHRAKSKKGALGLMQIVPRTGHALAYETRVKWKGIKTLYQPGINIAIGAYYLDKLINRYGDLSLALEAYNLGPTQLNRYLRSGNRPTFYSKRVFNNYKRLKSKPI